jgi:hypothetical protein
VYRVAGPISNWRIYNFVRSEGAGLDVSLSRDGRAFQPAQAERLEYPSGQTVYGYLTPVLYQGAAQGGAGAYLRIAVPASDGVAGQGAADAAASPPAAPLEISRVEIEYDCRTAKADVSSAPTSHKPPAPVNASIFVDSLQPLAATRRAIDDAAQRGDRRLNVVVTILVDLADDLRIKSFGGYRGRWGNYHEFDAALHDRLKQHLRQVFARLVHHHMEIFILPHIDAGGEVRTWRNWVDFDPSVPYGGHSYEELMIDSIADALADTVRADTPVELALSGEMGTSLFRYPASYRGIVRRLRERGQLKQLKIGVSLNHNKISGQGNPAGTPDIQLTAAQRAHMQALIDECDFVGMSFYRPVSVRPRVLDFVRGVEDFMDEFRGHGLSVPFTTPMHFSEVGIGGGHEEDDAAIDPAKAVESPWAGSGNPRVNPWRNPAMQQLRRQYHQALLEFLARQPARWRVSAAFFWSTGSWDPQGIGHPAFADPEIQREIRTHNRRSG